MKSYTVKYTRGHLIDQSTGQRIYLKRNGEFIVSAVDEHFQEKDDIYFDKKPLTATEKQASLERNHRGYTLVKLADAGQVFAYRIGIRFRSTEDKYKDFLFDAQLREDLYMKSKDGKKFTLCDCLCATHHCLDGALQMFEPVQGLSLSNLFSNVVAFYFTMQRSGSCNAFKTFQFAEHWQGLTLYEFKQKTQPTLADKRAKYLSDFQDWILQTEAKALDLLELQAKELEKGLKKH
jgi:hypothetical protein